MIVGGRKVAYKCEERLYQPELCKKQQDLH